MPAATKINIAMWGTGLAIFISVASVFIGAGVLMADQKNARDDIDTNTAAIKELEEDWRKAVERIQDQMREDKSEILKAIRSSQ